MSDHPVRDFAQDYRTRVLRYIPGDVVGTYTAANGLLLSQESADWLYWLLFGLAFVACIAWVIFIPDLSLATRIMAPIAFVFWAMSMPGAFTTIEAYPLILGPVLLIVFSGIVAPFVDWITQSGVGVSPSGVRA